MTYEQAVEKDGNYEVAYNGHDLECAMANGWKFVYLSK